MRAALLLAIVLAGCAKPPAEFAFTNASVTLPDDTAAFPPGPGAELVAANCSACHSAEQILNQPRLDRKAWEASVAKMVKVYKAPIAEADVPKIVDYLVGVSERLPEK